MDRRRAPTRPASTEEVDYWSHASKSLAQLQNIYTRPSNVDTIGRVNRLISAWPTDDVLPAEGYDFLKTNYKKLHSALKEVRHIDDEEVKAIDSVLEKLDVLIALRKAPELLSQEKRNKRPRPPSPTATAASVTPPLMSATRPMTTQVASSRSSTGPSPPIPFSREPKARREALAKQLPLQEGRKVAFHPPAGKAADGSAADADENTWILAVITKCINQDKNRYEVQDVEPQEDGQPGQCYNTTLRAIIPLPDLSAPPTNAAHLNAYQEFPAGSTVMALYPDTSCFYRAEVISSPRDVQGIGRGMSTKTIPTYKLKFEDDDDQEHSVAAQWVVEWPGV
ncbi:SGF29 tudor-like domain-containing protein [Suillus clintonianus]|uniref:SGF29 tudor-like domain-containing protein n=1 Tax=Suillus clintonianus TaxID=1904413 RepID=UPI001B8739A3|nr:SGF29 tudor-like domain-containing protein [Suillus clintonianus]KAG2151414.1 SGF29 tudor-like domain-containing protein [Suillus clintonianus]